MGAQSGAKGAGGCLNAVQTVLPFPKSAVGYEAKADVSKVPAEFPARCLANFSTARKTAWRTRKAAFGFGAKNFWREKCHVLTFWKGEKRSQKSETGSSVVSGP